MEPSNISFEMANQQKLQAVRKVHPNEYLEMNYELGENILITILDVVEKNPYSRIPNT